MCQVLGLFHLLSSTNLNREACKIKNIKPNGVSQRYECLKTFEYGGPGVFIETAGVFTETVGVFIEMVGVFTAYLYLPVA